MSRRYRRHSYDYAQAHVEAYHRLERELGGTVEDVKQYLFALTRRQLRPILQDYEQRYGSNKRNYAEKTLEKWRTGKRRMSGDVAERLVALLPPRMPLPAKYRLIESFWNHVGPKSKKTIRVGLDANIEQVLDAVRKHIEEVVVHFRIPESLEQRFNWLAAGDSHVKQDLLNHLRSLEKALVVDGARLRLPAILDHLRGESGRYTHRVAEILKIGNHELELLIDKSATGVAVVEPYVALRAPTSSAASFKWLWWVAAAIVIFYLFARH